MKLRWKSFLFLLCAGFFPLGIFALFTFKTATKTINAISATTKQEVSREVEQSILRSATYFATLLDQTRHGLEYALTHLARDASGVFSQDPPPGPIPQAPYFLNDFADPERAPAHLTRVHGYTVLSPLKPQELFLSLEHPVVVLPPQTPGVDARLAGQLQTLLPGLHQLRDAFGDIVLWVTLVLHNQLAMSFPGRSMLEQSFDPERSYELARKHPWRQLNWSLPIRDPRTRQVVLKVSHAFAAGQEGYKGAISVDTRLESIIRVEDIDERWINFVHCFFVSIPLEDAQRLVVEAERVAGPRQLWTKPARTKELASDDEKAFAAFMETIRHAKAGSAAMPYQGVPSIWAFSRFDQNTRLVFIAPASVALALPNKIAAIFRQFVAAQQSSIFFSAILACALAFGLAFFVSKRFDTHIRGVVDAWKRLAAGDFNVRINLPKPADERGTLYESFNRTVPKLAEYVRMSHDLGLAQEVQQELMPHHVPALPNIDLDGLSFSCVETGGDYYDFFMRNELEESPGNKLALAVGDVAGHGAGPAMLMVTVRAFLRQRARHKGSPVEVVSDVNRLLSHDVRDSGQFMTLFFLELDPHTLEISWVRAGHEPAFLYDTESDTFQELAGRGISLGIIGSYQYLEEHGRLKPGQVLIIGTDGIWETRDKNKNMFGKERFKECIRKNAHASCRDIIHATLSELETFTGHLDFEDDVTLLVLKVLPGTEDASSRQLSKNSFPRSTDR